MDDLARWKDRVAFVTGASSGIGLAVARQLADAGLRVALCARDAVVLRRIADELGAAGALVLPVPVDLRDEPRVRAAFTTVAERLGPVAVLVNSAGLGHEAPLIDGDTERWRELLEVNILAACVCTREAVAQMRGHGEGHVFHISSLSAYRVQSGSGLYAATKFALRAMTEELRLELHALGLPIRVTAISPGDTDTAFVDRMWAGQAARIAASRARYQQLDARDVAEALVFALARPLRVQIHDLLLRPLGQPD